MTLWGRVIFETIQPMELFNRILEAHKEKLTRLAGFLRQNVLWVLTACVLVSGGLAIYFYKQAAHLRSNLGDAAQAEVSEVEQLLAAVGKLIVLPEGETPTIATVSDLEKLKSQPFFVNAKNGDKVLIYTNAKKAILYDPVANKIIEVAPINIGNTPQPSVQ
ncbi:MAG: hypothetical protein Q8P56_05845 [Candidatus Uhrbacteria bacterium]|nr:hypothetical protein [Candidatus Uhrbacteria bacterium]